MKVKGFIIIGILSLLISGWAQAQGTFVIEGQVKNVKQGVCLNLFRMEGGVGSSIAVDTLRGDTFRFEVPASGAGIDRLVLVSLSIDDKTGWEIASRHHKITWWNLNDLKGQHGIYAKYTSGAIPRYVFLSPEGEVVEMWSGYGKGSLKLKMQQLLNTEKKADKL